jgi:hypothetical protein
MARERLAIDAWGSLIHPEGAANWPDEFLHIFKKYKSPKTIFTGMTMEYMLDEIQGASITLFLVEASAPGIKVKPQQTLHRLSRLSEIEFNRVEVNKSKVLGEISGGWPILQKARSSACTAPENGCRRTGIR